MAYQTLDAWITEVLNETDRKVTSIACMYEKPAGGSEEVLTEVTEGKTNDPERLFRLFKGRAEHHVQDRPGIQNFRLEAFYDKRPVPGRARHFIVSEGELKSGQNNHIVSERATSEGVLQQMMRHTENLVATNTMLVQTMATTWLQERREVLGYLSQALLETNDAYSLVREMRMRQQTEVHELEMRRLDHQRQTAERKMILEGLPATIAIARGQEMPGTVDTQIMTGIAQNMTDDDVDMMVQIGKLSLEQATPIKARLKQLRDKVAAERAELSRLPAGATADITPTNVTSIERARRTSGGQDSGPPAAQ